MRRSGGGGDIQNVQVGRCGDGAPRNTVIEQLLTALSRHTAKICISTATRDMRGMVLIGCGICQPERGTIAGVLLSGGFLLFGLVIGWVDP